MAGTYRRRRLVLLAAVATLGVLAFFVFRDSGEPREPSTDAEQLAAGINEADASLDEGIAEWRSDDGSGPVPEQVSEDADFIEDSAWLLAERPDLAAETIPRLSAALAAQTRDLTAAANDFEKLSGGGKAPELETQQPRPLPELLGHYREAERRFGVGWNYLAAINLVETKFGRVVSESVAGAQGPMQFIPETWEAYGMGGDIQDPHDAVLGAANLLRQNGAPGDYPDALLRYNPSRAYVDAVQRYAGLIARDPDAIYLLYAWEV